MCPDATTLMTTPEETVASIAEQLRESDREIRVSTLLHGAEEAGHPSAAAWRATVEVCEDETIQASWADWEHVSEQAELGFRLQVLVDCDRLHSELDDFLLFFFRASAPELYRHAALALGHHAWEHPDLEEDLRGYASQRETTIDEPIELTGDRSRRRLLLAATARYLHRPDGDETTPMPVVVESLETLEAHPAADIAVLSLACQRLVEAGHRDADVEEMCWELTDSIHRFLGESGSQRGLVRTWGQLLRALETIDPQRAAAIWTDSLARFEQRTDRTYAEHLATLWELDSAIAAAADEESRLLDNADVDEPGAVFETADFRWLARVRRWQWQRREGDTPPDPLSGSESMSEAVDPELQIFVREVLARVGAGDDIRRAMHRWLASRLEILAESSRWWSRPDASRALLSFLLLDAVRYRPPPRQTIRRLFEQTGISRAGISVSPEPTTDGIAGMPWDGFHDLLWQIFRLEGAPPDFPVESESFTSITNAERLLGFVRAGQAVRDLDILVDALEHFLRLELASDPNFSPRAFLYRIAARKPHPSLFRELSRRTRGRSYHTESGEEIDLRQMLDAVAEETGEGAFASRTREPTDPWFPALAVTRRSLRNLERSDDLQAALSTLADHVDPRIPDPTNRHRGLLDLLVGTIPEGGSVLLDSTARETAIDVDTLTAAITEHVRHLREAIDALFDGASAELTDMHRAARNASHRLEMIRDQLAPCVAEGDCELLTAVTDSLIDRIVDWADVLEDGLEAPLDQLESEAFEAVTPSAIFDRLGEVTADFDSMAMRTRAFRTAYELLERFPLADQPEGRDGELALDEQEAWTFEKDLLAEAVTATEDLSLEELWPEFLSDRWERLVSVAMDLQAEPSVVAIVTDPRFSKLRRRARQSVTVERLEQWLADRYHLRAMTALARDTRPGSGLPALPAALGRLTGNFTHVWLALLVGAVMILDFGDAWVELARLGDLTGIGITFGIGIGGTFLYVLADIVRKTQSPFEETSLPWQMSRLLRVCAFLVACSIYTVGVTSGLWYLFSGTDLVLHGDGATLHILVWTGFALFVGVFFGLLTESG